MRHYPHIMNAAPNLLAVCFVIIGGLKFTNSDGRSIADELAWLAAFLFLGSTLVSYWLFRTGAQHSRKADIADIAFICGLVSLTAAMATCVIYL